MALAIFGPCLLVVLVHGMLRLFHKLNNNIFILFINLTIERFLSILAACLMWEASVTSGESGYSVLMVCRFALQSE